MGAVQHRSGHYRTTSTGERVWVAPHVVTAQPSGPGSAAVAAPIEGADAIVTSDPMAQAPAAPAQPASHAAHTSAEWSQAADGWRRKAMVYEHQTQAMQVGGAMNSSSAVKTWVSAQSARVCKARAAICDAGGTADFPGLYRTNGSRVNARIESTSEGSRWMVFADDDLEQEGEVIRVYGTGPDLTKKGLEERTETAPAWARIGGHRGRSGKVETFVEVFRLDRGRALANKELAAV